MNINIMKKVLKFELTFIAIEVLNSDVAYKILY